MKIAKLIKWVGLIAGMLALTGNSFAATSNSTDPFEIYNRNAFQFNQNLDKIALKPVATIYNQLLPRPAKKGVVNFFDNLGELPTIANELLQANFKQAAGNSWRFVINSTIGLLGFFDVASHMGLPKSYTDFGITLQRWGISPTPYLVMPIFGPSTITDALSIPVNYQFNAFNYIKPNSLVYSALAVNVIARRAALLKYGNAEDVAIDPYVFQRNVYMQRRAALLAKAKGNIPNDLENGYDFAND